MLKKIYSLFFVFVLAAYACHKVSQTDESLFLDKLGGGGFGS